MLIATLVMYAFVGAIAGLLGGLLGIGGGLVVVPFLLIVFYFLDFSSEFSMQTAVGTSLALMLFTSASSAWAHIRLKGVQQKLIITLGPGVATGGLFGAYIADFLPSHVLKMIFALLVCIIGFVLVFWPNVQSTTRQLPLNFLVLIPLSLVIGGISTMMGIGGGIFMVPALVAMGLSIRKAVSTSAVLGFLIAIVGVVLFLFLGLKREGFEGGFGYLYVPALFPMALFSLLAAPFGARLAYKLPESYLKSFFGVFLILTGLMMLVF